MNAHELLQRLNLLDENERIEAKRASMFNQPLRVDISTETLDDKPKPSGWRKAFCNAATNPSSPKLPGQLAARAGALGQRHPPEETTAEMLQGLFTLTKPAQHMPTQFMRLNSAIRTNPRQPERLFSHASRPNRHL